MYKILLVDDNKREARVVLESLDWAEYNAEIVGAATDGREALAFMERELPDIVLTDISMPALNGIELAKRINASYPAVKVVFLSCHADFDYAKSAIDLNIEGYLLKPVDLGELAKMVAKVTAKCDLERCQAAEREVLEKQLAESRPLLIEDFYRNCVTGMYHSLDEIRVRAELLGLDAGRFRGVVVVCSQADYRAGGADSFWAEMGVRNILAEGKGLNVAVIRNLSGRFVSILFFSEGAPEVMLNRTLDYVTDAHDRAQLTAGARLSSGISLVSDSVLELTELLRQAETALKTKFYSNGNPIILFSEIEETGEAEGEKFDLSALNAEINEKIFMGGEEDIGDFIERYYSGRPPYSDSEAAAKNLTYAVVTILQLSLFEKGMDFADVFEKPALLWEKLNAFETIIDLRQWLYNLFSAVKKIAEQKGKSKASQLVSAVKEIVRKRYSEDITISDIAKEIYLSSRQANFIFKKETGLTIYDYLVEYRMEIAKKLIKGTDMKITAIIREVGYVNNSYFIVIFKRYTGMTPSEYRNKPVL